MRSTPDVYLRMRDGVRIPVDIYRPDGPGPFPAVLIRTPYIKSAPDLQPPAPPPAWLGLTPEGRSSSAILRLVQALPALNVLPLVEAGYAVVVGDSRGTGHAEGVYDYYNVDGGPFDGYDTVEWLAEQEWCDGNVGMFGVSGSGVLALAAAVTAPPHLKAVVAMAHPVDLYHDQWFPGGVYRFEDRVRWALIMQGPLAPLDPGSPSAPAYEDKRRVFAARYARFFDRMRAGLSMIDLGWATASTQHADFDDYWHAYDFSPRLASITAPTLTAGVLFDHFSSGTTRMFGGLTVPKRMVLVPGMLDIDGAVGGAQLSDLQLRWFDRFLRGSRTRSTGRPPSACTSPVRGLSSSQRPGHRQRPKPGCCTWSPIRTETTPWRRSLRPRAHSSCGMSPARRIRRPWTPRTSVPSRRARWCSRPCRLPSGSSWPASRC
jgi:uncharacterized protein